MSAKPTVPLPLLPALASTVGDGTVKKSRPSAPSRSTPMRCCSLNAIARLTATRPSSFWAESSTCARKFRIPPSLPPESALVIGVPAPLAVVSTISSWSGSGRPLCTENSLASSPNTKA